MKAWDKFKEFWSERKAFIIPIVAGVGGAVGGYLLRNVQIQKHRDEGLKTSEQENITEKYDWGNRMLNTIMDYEDDCEKGKNFWYDAYREKWDKVSALAKEMDDAMLLGDGEFFVIEGTNPDCNEECARYFVHHMVDDMPSYPPEMVHEEG